MSGLVEAHTSVTLIANLLRCLVVTSTTREMHVPYIVPSENGGRSDVSWIALHSQSVNPASIMGHDRPHPAMTSISQEGCVNSATAGLLVSMPHYSVAQVSAQHHALEALCTASHTHELEEMADAGDGSVHLHVDHLHMGIGGDDSWTPSVHPNFIIPPGNEWNWSFTLAPTQSDCDVRVLHNELHAIS